MSDFDADFHDLKNRKKMLNNKPLTPCLHLSCHEKKGLTTGVYCRSFPTDKEIGKGATGTVYLGHDQRTEQKVAIKVLPLADEFSESDVEVVKQRFFREAETAGHLNHPNIVKIYDAGEVEGLAYIAMQLLSGHDLTRYTKKTTCFLP